MDVFGETWRDHAARLRANWTETVGRDDAVLVPGDISWAMKESEAEPDFAFIGQLPGRKVLVKGNHDYWWSTLRKVRALAGPDVFPVQAGAVDLGTVAVAGSRGWELPGSARFSAEDEKIFRRETERLRLSLEAASAIGKPIVAMMHFPPLSLSEPNTPFSELLESFGVSFCVYGHLHGNAHRQRVEGVVGTVEYRLVSADYLDFTPLLLPIPS